MKKQLGKIGIHQRSIIVLTEKARRLRGEFWDTKLVIDMEGAIKTVVMQFLSATRGKESLSSKSFQKLVQSQLGNIMSDTDSSSAVKDMMKGLDDNQDGKCSFQEYMTLIGYVASSLSEQKGQANAAGGQ